MIFPLLPKGDGADNATLTTNYFFWIFQHFLGGIHGKYAKIP